MVVLKSGESERGVYWRLKLDLSWTSVTGQALLPKSGFTIRWCTKQMKVISVLVQEH